MKPRLLITEPGAYSERLIHDLSGSFDVHCAEVRDSGTFLDVLRQQPCEALLVGLGLRVASAELDVATTLQVVACPATGTDHLDVSEIHNRGINLFTLQGRSAELGQVSGTAELAWGLLLALVRGFPRAFRAVDAQLWNRDEHVGMQLREKTLAVIGYGRLGHFVVDYGRAFGMHVVVVDPDSIGNYRDVEVVDLETAFRRADVISLHVPLNSDTEKFVDAELLKLCKNSVLLVNTSRGEVVDENAVADSIRRRAIAGYATDVLSSDSSWNGRVEMNPITPLIKEGFNVIVTPHIGGCTREGIDVTRELIIQDLLGWAAARR